MELKQTNGDAPDLIGRAVGAYRLVKLLGEGGMGAVYLGEHPAIGSHVAIKLLHPKHVTDPQVVERFFNEARAVNLIGHDNIVKVLDYDVTHDGRYYCVMELLEGRPLEALVRRGRPLPLRVAGPIFLQCCRALQAAHARGIVHRDLKPDNVFLIKQGERDHFVKLLDFGIAKLGAGEASRQTNPGVIIGTPAYMSPEQAAGDVHLVSPRSDIYSLGVMMFQVATGRTPFAARDGSLRSLLMAQVHQPPPLLRAFEPNVPEPYEKLVLFCLGKEPAARWQSMEQLHDALLRCMRELSISPDLPKAAEVAGLEVDDSAPAETPQDTGQNRKLRRRWPMALALAALAAGAAIYTLRPRPQPTAPPVVPPPIVRNQPPVPPPITPPPAKETPPPPKIVAKKLPKLSKPKPRPQPVPEPIPPQEPPEQPEVVAVQEEKKIEPAPAPAPPPPPPPAPPAPVVIEKVRLLLVARPRAVVEATWPGGSAHAQTPGEVEVPKGAAVKLTFSAQGYQSQIIELQAKVSRAVTATLARPE